MLPCLIFALSFLWDGAIKYILNIVSSYHLVTHFLYRWRHWQQPKRIHPSNSYSSPSPRSPRAGQVSIGVSIRGLHPMKLPHVLGARALFAVASHVSDGGATEFRLWHYWREKNPLSIMPHLNEPTVTGEDRDSSIVTHCMHTRTPLY
jgi:hypothetical protein